MKEVTGNRYWYSRDLVTTIERLDSFSLRDDEPTSFSIHPGNYACPNVSE